MCISGKNMEHFFLLKIDKQRKILNGTILMLGVESELTVYKITIFIFQRDYAESVGGHSPKANISRILKRTFCDELACKCSWLGQRGNIKVCDLKLINILEGT